MAFSLFRFLDFISFRGGGVAMRNFQNLEILVFRGSAQMDGFQKSAPL
jgi:hypothetical protein